VCCLANRSTLDMSLTALEKETEIGIVKTRTSDFTHEDEHGLDSPIFGSPNNISTAKQ
jgi:hypothetical protein